MTTFLIIIAIVIVTFVVLNTIKVKPKPKSISEQKLKELDILMTDGCGTDQDEMPEGYGEFGLEITNPIPTSSIMSNRLYLDKLRTLDGSTVTYNRIGSMGAPNILSIIDGYTIFANGKQIATLYVCPYNKKTSTKAPKGFKLV